MLDIIKLVLGVVALVAVIYASYWIAKNVSYAIFYRGMVIESIESRVKPSCLNNN